MVRTKIKLKTSMVGSSDVRRLKAKDAILAKNHKEFEKSTLFMATQKSPIKVVEPKLTDTVMVFCFDKYISCQYEIVKNANCTNYKWI